MATRKSLSPQQKIAVAGTIAGCEGPTDIADFARPQLACCRKFVPLTNGVPSHDTISRVLSLH